MRRRSVDQEPELFTAGVGVFDEATRLVEASVRGIEGITLSVAEQCAACYQVSENVERISQMTEENTGSISKACRVCGDLADRMKAFKF